MKVIVERSKRRTLSLTVSAGGDVVVRAPLSSSDETIRSFVARHKRWIENRLARQKAFSLADGAEIGLFGKTFVIAEGRARISGDTLFLPAEGREGALASLLKRLSAREMKQLTAELSSRFGFTYSSVRISSARTRWGSCNAKGSISYSFRIAFLPYDLAYYVAVHELCHTRVLNHSVAFWKEVAACLPDYAARRKRLRGYEWCMQAL